MLRTTFIKTGFSVVMLVMLSFVVGGCASQQARLLKKRQEDVLKSYRIQVANTFDDPERADQLINVAEDLYLQLRNDTKVLLEITEELKKLNGAYDTTREELEAVLQDLNSHRRKMRETIMAARAGALSLTTPEEWQELMDRRGTLLEFIGETPGFL